MRIENADSVIRTFASHRCLLRPIQTTTPTPLHPQFPLFPHQHLLS